MKPLLSAHDTFRWWLYRARGQKSFVVMGQKITVLPKDHGVSRELAVHRVHEPLATRLLLQTLEPGMNVVDIGSNLGYYALLEAQAIGPQGKVIAIEPVPENAEQLNRNILANGHQNILVNVAGIADRNGEAEMHISRKSNWHSFHPVPWPTTTLRVPVSTLDNLLKGYAFGHVDLLRMDLEGYEVIVIKGMQRTLKKYGPRLLVELHPHLTGSQAILKYLHLLEQLGYGIEWLVDQERDVTLRWRFTRVEKPTMKQLMDDPRICSDPRALTVLFVKGAQENLADPAKAMGWKIEETEEHPRSTVLVMRSFVPRATNSSN